MKKWNSLGLADEVLLALENIGLDSPLPVQEKAIPRLIAGESLAVTAPTGTGKTLAYLAPLYNRLDLERDAVQAVVLAPTYELAVQIAAEQQKLADNGAASLRCQALIGGANITRQIERLKRKPQLIVGSIGRIAELCRLKKLKLDTVKVLIFDEFDRLVDDQNLTSLAELMRLLPPVETLQKLFFSATAPKKALERIAFMGDFSRLAVGGHLAMPEQIEHYWRETPFREKIEAVRRLTRSLNINRGLVFVSRRSAVEWTAAKFAHDGLNVASLAAAQNKQERQSAIAAFKAGRARLLLTTDIAARGLDFPNVDAVFNLDIPETPSMYLHRAGRTGRAGAAGKVITLLDPKEKEKFFLLARKLNILSADIAAPKSAAGKPKKAEKAAAKEPRKAEKPAAKRPTRKPTAEKPKRTENLMAEKPKKAKTAAANKPKIAKKAMETPKNAENLSTKKKKAAEKSGKKGTRK